MALISNTALKSPRKRAKRTKTDSQEGVTSGRSMTLPNRLVSAKVELMPASLRNDMVREAAYYHAEARGFAPGRELEDWLAAELEIDELITSRYRY